MDLHENPDTTTEEVAEVKKSLVRKVLIVAGATAGLIIVGTLFSRGQDDTDEDSETETPLVVVTDPVAA